MATLTSTHSANRRVREYVERVYLPAAASHRLRAHDKGALADQVIVWRRKLENGWPALHLGHTSVETRDDRYHFTVEVELGALPPDPVRVELFADASDEQRPV
jgi:starch phosphorylase